MHNPSFLHPLSSSTLAILCKSIIILVHPTSTTAVLALLQYLTGNDELSDAEERMLGAKVTRLNFSELYQHLNAASVLQQLVDRQLLSPAKKTDAESYRQIYVQNHVSIAGLFTMDNPPSFLLHLCDILEASCTGEHSTLAAKLRSGTYVI